MAKTDLKSAFRLIPIHPEDWSLLGIYWQSQYYVNMYLPFGLRSAPFLFNQLSDGIEWILKHDYGLKHVIHILDDFFIAEHSKLACLTSFSTLLRVFMLLKAPTVASITIGPSQQIEFMGIVLDSVRMEARLPQDKLIRIKDLLGSFQKRRSVRLIELQSLIGTLQFACKVVVPGRTFLQRAIDLTRRVPSRCHHVRLNREFFKDLAMWRVFITKWNGRSFFLESSTTPAPDLELFTDAPSTSGFGGFFRGKWFQGRWPPHLRLDKDRGISIEWQELFPIVVVCAIWHPFFAGKRLQFWCDNESVVTIINSGHSKAPRIMDLVRFLVLISMKHDFLVRARHVPGVSNKIADALSRFQMQRTILGPCSRSRPESLYHPAFINDPLREEVLHYANWGVAKNTNQAYSFGEKWFLQFCLMNRLLSPAASEGTVVYFASYLARSVRHSTIKLYLAAVRNLHIITSGFNDPLKGKLLLRKVLRGILRFQGERRIRRQPVTPRVLLAIRPLMQSWLSPQDFRMVWAAFNLAFFAFLRCREFTYPGARYVRPQFDLTTDCVAFYPNLACPQLMTVTLQSSKTDTFR